MVEVKIKKVQERRKSLIEKIKLAKVFENIYFKLQRVAGHN